LKPKLIHNVTHFDGELHADSWALLTPGAAVVGKGATWEAHSQGAEVVDGQGQVLLSGFIDTHCHGAYGASANDGLAGMRTVLDFNFAHGVARSLLSLVSSSHVEVLDLCNQAKELLGDPRFLGLHLEGPYLAHSHKGAHDPAKLAIPETADLKELIATGVVKSMTIAPELFAEGQLELLEAAGITLCLGHTNVDYQGAKNFFESHPSALVTHAFNGMRGIHHREPGPVPAAIEAGVFIELIMDGVHVHEPVAKLLPAAQLLLVTDAMSATGMPDGSYLLGSMSVQVKDSIARTEVGGLAGSTLTMAAAVRNYARVSGSALAALRAATVNPARAYGIELPELSLENHVLLAL
jgi:N-acetylglucosamine-6-phosphate deacetylase